MARKRQTALLIEGVPAVARMIGSVLADDSYRVTSVPSDEFALQALDEPPPSLITDNELPRSSGLDLLRATGRRCRSSS